MTEYGTAYLHGKSIRERALALIQIAHPKFQPWLFGEAKARHMIYADQIELPVHTHAYPDALERMLLLKDKSRAFLRPLKLTDEPLVRELFYQLSAQSVHYRFFHMIKSMPHHQLQELLRVDYENDMVLVVLTSSAQDAAVVAIAHYRREPHSNMAEAAFLVRDDWQGKGVGTALMQTLVEAARRNGIAGFTADVLLENHGMLRIFHRCGFPVESRLQDGVYQLDVRFTAPPRAAAPRPAAQPHVFTEGPPGGA